MRVDRSGFLALVAAMAGSACGSSPSTPATGPNDAGSPDGGGTTESDGNGGADGRSIDAIDDTAADEGGTSGADASGDSDDGPAFQADAQSLDGGISGTDGGVMLDAAADTSACANPCARTCCAAGSVCVDDGRGNQQCGRVCTDSAQCPSSAPCCGPAQEGLCGNVGTTWACLPTNFCAGAYCRCAANSACGPTQEGLPGVCGPLIQSGAVSPPVCNAPATKTTLYIHGRDTAGIPAAWSYWLRARPGVNATPVNWIGTDRIATTNPTVRAALNAYCTGNNWCYVACHSAGCAQIGYALANFGTTGSSDNWNIYWIAAAGSAEGGSELANTGQFVGGGVPLDADLTTAAMRDVIFYNHDNTAGVMHYMFAGDGWSDRTVYNFASAVLPGADDTAVAYHSAGGVNNTAYAAQTRWCNATDSSLGCNLLGSVLPLGVSSAVWALHTVYFLDATQPAGLYSHYLGDSNEGICSQMFPFMSTYAL